MPNAKQRSVPTPEPREPSDVWAAKIAAKEAYADLAPVVSELRSKGQTLRAIADELNRQGHTTRRGKPWNQVQVLRVLGRA
jgi:hypothetical protein